MPILAVAAVGVDGGRVFVERQRIQTAAEAAAMAAAGDWVRTGTACSQGAMALVASNADSSASATCTTTGERYSGVVTVSATKDVPATFASIVRRSSSTVRSTASVRVEPAAAMRGFRPTAICQQSSALAAWKASGFTSTQIYRLGFTGDCEGVAGNWGIFDFDGGSNGTVDLREWIANGWSGTVSIGETFSGDPGSPSPAVDINSIMNITIAVPVYDSVILQGSTSIYHVSAFVGMKLVAAQLSGANSTRYMDVQFVPITDGIAAGSPNAPNYGVVTWVPCQLDGMGVCS